MKKLTKDQQTQKDVIFNKLDEQKGEVEAAINKFNELMQEARDYLEPIVSDMESYYDEKSEKWQEGEAGDQYNSWKDRYQELMDELEDIEMPEVLEKIEEFDSLPTCPEEV